MFLFVYVLLTLHCCTPLVTHIFGVSCEENCLKTPSSNLTGNTIIITSRFFLNIYVEDKSSYPAPSCLPLVALETLSLPLFSQVSSK